MNCPFTGCRGDFPERRRAKRAVRVVDLARYIDRAEASQVAGKWMFASEPGGRPHLSAWSVGIAGASREKDLAWEWTKAYTSGSSQKLFYLKLGIGPARMSVYVEQELSKGRAESGWLRKNLQGASPRFRFPQSEQCFACLDQKILEALTAGITPRQALRETAERWRELLADTKPGFPYTDDTCGIS